MPKACKCIKDYDSLYLIIYFCIFITHVQAPRELRLAINRSGDSIGIVSVDYNIIYLPLGTTDPSQVNLATALTFTGSVQLQGGQTLRDFSLTVPNSAFLETGGNFMATIDNATLIGGGNSHS